MPKQSNVLMQRPQLRTSLVSVEFYGNDIAVIKLHDHEGKNKLSASLIEGLLESFEHVRTVDQCKVVVLAGLDKHFILEDEEHNHRDLQLQTAIVEFDLPVIAAMAGDASGTGWLLGLCCDGVVYADEGSYCYSGMNYGYTPYGGATLVFPKKLDNYLAREILFTGKSYSGEQLKSMTVCTSVARIKVEETALEMARKWTSFSLQHLYKLKKQLSRQLREGLIKSHQEEERNARQLEQAGCVTTATKNQNLTIAKKVEISSDTVLVEAYENGVVIVKMCDRKSKNTFSESLGSGLLEAFEHIKNNTDYKVVILTGYGNYFACGGNKEGLLAIQSGEVKFTDAKVHALTLTCDIPVIAAMQGHGIGAGWALGMFCDFSVFGKESTYTSNYMRYGFTPGAGATLIFPERFGDDLAWEILFTAKEYKGAELEERGTGMPVVPRDKVVEYAMEMANHLALSNRLALVLLKTQLCQDLRDRLACIFQKEVEMHEKTFVGNDDVFEKIQTAFTEHSVELDEPLQFSVPEDNIPENIDPEILRNKLCRGLADELYLDVDAVDDDSQFIDMGLDSVTGVAWTRNINKEFGLDIAATKVYDYPTIDLLADYIGSLITLQDKDRESHSDHVDPVDKISSLAQNENVTEHKAESGNSADNTVLLDDIRCILRNGLADELYMDADSIDDDMQFIDAGLDSVTGVSWIRKINDKLGLDITATKVYDYPTINIFAKYVMEEGHKNGIFIKQNENKKREKDAVTKVVIEDPEKKQKIENMTVDAVPTIAVLQNSPPTLKTEIVNKATDETTSECRPDRVSFRKISLKTADEAIRSHDGRDSSVSPPAIAIIGMSGQFPQAKNLTEFWENLASGQHCISEIPKSRWDMHHFFDADPDAPGKTYCDRMGVLEDVDKFDPLFFNISPAEAKFIDPQQRLFLENCWSSMEDAGLSPSALSGSRCGVYVGCNVNNYAREQTAQDLMGSATSILSARIAYLLDLKGPCMAIDTACSSSLVAIAEACNSLAMGTSDIAFSGGVCVLSGPELHIMTSKSGMLSRDNRCFTFDARANGFVPGEGVGVIVLKRLSDAVRDRDSIAGVIRGWGVNQDGKTNGITAPSVNSQIQLEKDVYQRFTINPESISLVEAHGTGTPLGDPIEVEALTRSFRSYTRKKSYCALGSVKSNIGHLMPAAGVSGVIKILLALKHRMLPPTINFETLNEHITLEDSPFYINTELQNWQDVPGQVRRAAVSSFGFSGTNAHLVIEEYLPGPQSRVENEDYPVSINVQAPPVFVLSAKSEAQLKVYAKRMLDYVQAQDNLNLADMTYTLQTGRGAMNFRLAILPESKQALLDDLQVFIKGETSASVISAKVNKRQEAVTVFNTDKDAKALLDTWMKKKKLKKLARLWVSGLDIDWQKIYVNDQPRRINLPTYPFSDERYWNTPSENNALYEALFPKNVDFPEGVSDGPVYSVLQKLTEMVSYITGIAADRIDVDSDFEALGLDSILIASLNTRLEAWTGKLDPTLFFKYKTLSSLASYLEKSLEKNVEKSVEKNIETNHTEISKQQDVKPVVVYPEHKVEKNKSAQQLFRDQDIAIIGMSGKYPHANNLSEYWDNLCEGRDCIGEIPIERFDYRPLFSTDKSKAGSIYSKWGGFIDDIDKFDALFFNVSPQDARAMDPQERIFLENSWECLESAGYIGPDWQKQSRNVSVFAGVTFNNYQLIAADAAQHTLLASVNSQMFSIANHVSYFFNFTGPSLTVDTACSSSLYAIHLACESIKRGEAEMAIAGGVNLSLHPSKYFTICSRGFAASDGHCHAFAEGGDGYVPGEGVGTVLLKSFEQAVEDGDQILAVIKGSGVSHDGKTQSYTVPNPLSQTKAIEAAFKQADISPDTISYIEAHGTGTPLGDPIEITGLMDVFSKHTNRKQFCSIGSVKSNIGHGEAVAGVSQLTKTVLQMQHKTLVPSLLHSPLNASINFKETAFFVQQNKSSWLQPVINGNSVPRRAGVSSFGAGGVNVHVIVEEFIPVNTTKPVKKEQLSSDADAALRVIIPFSAHVQSQLYEQVCNFICWLKNNDENGGIADIAYTLQCRRAFFRFRLAFVVKDKQDLLEQLTCYVTQNKTGETGKKYYEADSKEPENISARLGSSEKDQCRLATLTEQRDLDTLAKFWAYGTDIHWQDWQYNGHIRCCLSLPTYAFLKKRYWIKDAVDQRGDATGKMSPPKETAPILSPANRAATEKISTPAVNDNNICNTSVNSEFLVAVFELSEVDREASFNRFLEEHIKSVLEFDPDDTLDANLGFFELGMESMQTLSLQQRLEKELSLELSDTALFDYPSINQLTGYLMSIISWEQLEEGISDPGMFSPPDSAGLYQSDIQKNELPLADVVPEDIENLSEEEVIAELLNELEP